MLQIINGKIDGFVGETKIYIGRSNQTHKLRNSPLQNPFRIGIDGNREQVINKYQRWLHQQVIQGLAGNSNSVFNELVKIAKLVKMGKSVQLTCWCKPKLCHGDVIKRYIDWLNKEDQDATM